MPNDIVWDDDKSSIVWDDAKPKAAPTGRLDRALTGLMDPIVGAAQIMERTRVPGLLRKALGIDSSMDDYTRQRDAEYVAPEGVDWARMAGNVANPLTWMGGGASAAGKVLPAAGKAMTALAPTAARIGAVQGTLAPVDADTSDGSFLLKKAVQAGMGAGLGKAADVLTRARATPNAEALLQQGVRVPLGAAMGGRAARIEEKMSSHPLAGDVVINAREQALRDVQEKAIERATGTPGLRTIDDANDAVSRMYQRAVPTMQANPSGIFDAANAYNAALTNPELTPVHRDILTGLWDKNFANYSQLDGAGLKRLDSELGHLQRKYRRGSPADQSLAEELQNIDLALRSGLEQGMPPAEAQLLRAANSGYRGMIPINKAASTRADELATPRALQKAIARQRNTDVTRMPPDRLLDPAVDVLTAKVPDSGTAGRAATMNPLMWLTGGLETIPASLAYTQPVSNMLLGRTRPQRALAPYATPATGAMVSALRE